VSFWSGDALPDAYRGKEETSGGRLIAVKSGKKKNLRAIVLWSYLGMENRRAL
jgi:hypothetical protein